jgi:putative transposase
LSHSQRRALIERDDAELALATQADLLSLSRASLYYQAKGPSAEEVELKHWIDAISTDYPFYGSRRIAVELHSRHQRTIARRTVQRHMREMGIAGIAPGPNLSQRHPQHRVYPYLLPGVTAQQPNHIWGIDITYVRLGHGWMYLVAVLDWFSRYVVSWALDDTLELPFVLEAVEQALTIAIPEVWNSDQGSHFTSPQYTKRVEASGARISMDGKGRALDNIFTERFWRSLKYEEVYLTEYATPRDARQGISRYIQFYNTLRPHQALGYLVPAIVYATPPTCE